MNPWQHFLQYCPTTFKHVPHTFEAQCVLHEQQIYLQLEQLHLIPLETIKTLIYLFSLPFPHLMGEINLTPWSLKVNGTWQDDQLILTNYHLFINNQTFVSFMQENNFYTQVSTCRLLDMALKNAQEFIFSEQQVDTLACSFENHTFLYKYQLPALNWMKKMEELALNRHTLVVDGGALKLGQTGYYYHLDENILLDYPNSKQYQGQIKGGILADGPGFGKTVITLCLIEECQSRQLPPIYTCHLPTKSTLVVVPHFLIEYWKQQITTFLPNKINQCLVIYDINSWSQYKLSDLEQAFIVITSWEFLQSEEYTRVVNKHFKSLLTKYESLQDHYPWHLFKNILTWHLIKQNELKNKCIPLHFFWWHRIVFDQFNDQFYNQFSVINQLAKGSFINWGLSSHLNNVNLPLFLDMDQNVPIHFQFLLYAKLVHQSSLTLLKPPVINQVFYSQLNKIQMENLKSIEPEWQEKYYSYLWAADKWNSEAYLLWFYNVKKEISQNLLQELNQKKQQVIKKVNKQLQKSQEICQKLQEKINLLKVKIQDLIKEYTKEFKQPYQQHVFEKPLVDFFNNNLDHETSDNNEQINWDKGDDLVLEINNQQAILQGREQTLQKYVLQNQQLENFKKKQEKHLSFFNQQMKYLMEKTESCQICMHNKPIMILKCAHMCCKQCIIKLLNEESMLTCPWCKREQTLNQVVEITDLATPMPMGKDDIGDKIFTLVQKLLQLSVKNHQIIIHVKYEDMISYLHFVLTCYRLPVYMFQKNFPQSFTPFLNYDQFKILLIPTNSDTKGLYLEKVSHIFFLSDLPQEEWLEILNKYRSIKNQSLECWWFLNQDFEKLNKNKIC